MNSYKINVIWILIACNQHLAGLPGGRVDGQDWFPGGLGLQLFDVQENAYTAVQFLYTDISVFYIVKASFTFQKNYTSIT